MQAKPVPGICAAIARRLVCSESVHCMPACMVVYKVSLAGCRRVALIHHPDKLHQDVAKAANNDGTFTLAKTALELILDPTKQRRLHMQLAYSRVCKRR